MGKTGKRAEDSSKDRIGNDAAFGYRRFPASPTRWSTPTGQCPPGLAAFHLPSQSRMDEKDLTERFARADRYLRDAGVFYRAYGSKGSAERSWPLSHVPVLIDEREWQTLSAGLVQRAELLEAIAADIYGANRLVEEGVPAACAHRRQPGIPAPAGRHHCRPAATFLHFCAFEIGRGPDGNWWVLADRTQAPSGAGFALENRVATTRAFSDIYAETPVHRLAGFFGAFRDALQGMKQRRRPHRRSDAGAANETYYEHAYIARYLGFMLLEGEDLTVVNGKVMVRTVAGLKPISVLWRRLDAALPIRWS
jgi:uncharacterized circularly permuted ATP-grasp superfamily protein